VSFLGRHAGFQVLLLFHFQMQANLFREIVHRLPPAKQRTEFGKLAVPAHPKLSVLSYQLSAITRQFSVLPLRSQ